jgi:hypothetical protein
MTNTHQPQFTFYYSNRHFQSVWTSSHTSNIFIRFRGCEPAWLRTVWTSSFATENHLSLENCSPQHCMLPINYYARFPFVLVLLLLLIKSSLLPPTTLLIGGMHVELYCLLRPSSSYVLIRGTSKKQAQNRAPVTWVKNLVSSERC